MTMPLDASGSMLKAVGTGIALIGLCSAPALGGIVTRLNKRDVHQEVYEDGDGKATPESMKAYSARLPKSLVVASGASGLVISIALLVISPRAEGRLLIDSLTSGAWVRRHRTSVLHLNALSQDTDTASRGCCCSRR